jgi:hypothetical protein
LKGVRGDGGDTPACARISGTWKRFHVQWSPDRARPAACVQADLSGNRHVVQVFDKAEKKIFATLLAIPNDRMEPSDEPVVMFAERPVGSPQAVKVWYYPGERIGNEFVYPKSVAMKIAKANHQSVLAMDDTSSSDAYKTAQVGRFDENGAWQVEGNNAVATTAQATTAPRSTTASEAPRSTTMAQAAPAAGTANNTTGTSGRTRRQLPRTASPLPLYELLSGLSIAGGLVGGFAGPDGAVGPDGQEGGIGGTDARRRCAALSCFLLPIRPFLPFLRRIPRASAVHRVNWSCCRLSSPTNRTDTSRISRASSSSSSTTAVRYRSSSSPTRMHPRRSASSSTPAAA